MYNEILDIIIDKYSDVKDEEYLAELLSYLYKTTKDYKMQNEITEIMDDLERCVECGQKLELYEYDEVHTELDGNPIEKIREMLCSDCDSDYIERNNYELA